MATVTLGVQTADTSNTTSYTSGSFTPAAGDLLVAIVSAVGSFTPAPSTMSDSQGLGWTRLLGATWLSGANSVWVFVANKLAANSAMTVTFDCTGDAATGVITAVFRIAGAEGTYVRQVGQNTFASGGTPQIGSAVGLIASNTNNPCLGMISCGTNPPAVMPPSTWAADTETGHGTPAHGQEVTWINSGWTTTGATWGSTAPSAGAVVFVEVYAAGQGPEMVQPMGEGGFFGVQGTP